MEDNLQLSLVEARHSDCSVEVRNGKVSLSFIQLWEEVMEKSNSPLHLTCAMGDLGKVKVLCVFSHIDVSNKNGECSMPSWSWGHL